MTTDALPISSRRRWRKPAIAVLVLAIAGGAYLALRPHPAPTPTPAAAQPAKPVVYELAATDVAVVTAGSLAVQLPLSGSLVPVSQATVKSKVSGVVQDASLREGMAVAAGQVLARIDQADLRARLTQQQAMLDEAQARLSMAQKNENNSRALLAQKYISQTAYDTNANAVDLARASVKAASAQLELARIALADSVIRAPIDGIVSKRHVQAGEKVAPDMAVYTIVSLAELTLEAQVPTSDIPRIKVGQEAAFRVDGFAGRTFAGKVARVNPTTEAGSRAMLVYITVSNGDGALRGGMFAKGSIVTERTAALPQVPVAAVHEENGRAIVHKVSAGKVVAQPVTLGLRNEDEGMAAVTDGLAHGEQVIVSRLDGVKPGASVKLPQATSITTAQDKKPAVKPPQG
ncbi:efflux RND transporter periplasmic adaptor subunit [Pseudoduganella plicata]|uniref:Efflux RND transporter periplasmic adaptor subunit n=1 Tax=Pseudoduganella plicata TaxID=321984 RepID=A0A4P7BF03_9BURK|nr:efflux RND transporter periplasmic adaptor subunit [Pseudoduganella plicata]QBQ36763.1 efflux RND transporter periplasmic adaptor subunit [Pseudoduganella plicata]GGY72928.1 hemolysin D [Pseudoduganella plicata]